MESIKTLILQESDFVSFKICAASLASKKPVPNPHTDVPFIAQIVDGETWYFPLSRWDLVAGQFLTIRELWFTHVASGNNESDANFRCKVTGVSILLASETLHFEWRGNKWVGSRVFVDMDSLAQIHTEDDSAIRDRYAEIALKGLISREDFSKYSAELLAEKAWELAECMIQLRK